MQLETFIFMENKWIIMKMNWEYLSANDDRFVGVAFWEQITAGGIIARLPFKEAKWDRQRANSLMRSYKITKLIASMHN